ncbi:MAG: glycerate kinase [Candidatus Bathyarchaeia archaeon]
MAAVRIRNREEILSNAGSEVDRRAREIILNSIEKGIEAANPKNIVRSKVKIINGKLIVNGEAFDLKSFKRIFVVGGGKASGYMAETIEEILGDRISDGIIVVPRGTSGKLNLNIIKVHEASHPIPDESSVEGARKILELVRESCESDLILCLISGGGSSLMACPREGITLEDKKMVTEILLRCGAKINEINAVRKHLSRFKGGHLARAAYPATVISLLLSDVIGDPIDVIASGPTVPDPTTFRDAINVLKKYNVWDAIPEAVRNLLTNGDKGSVEETPKAGDPCFKKVHNFVIGNNRSACMAVVDELRREGLNTLLLTTFMEGEARVIGSFLGTIAKEIIVSGNPTRRPAGIVVGGETTVTVTGKGKGGRNQEIALASALYISGMRGVAIASFSTDGVDGPTDAAGAIVDGATVQRSRNIGLNPEEYLLNNDSYNFFKQLGDLIFTGPTGTNVNDVAILIVL